MTSLLGKKIQQGQRFLENGARIPVTFVDVAGNTVVSLKTEDKDKYIAVQMGLGQKKKGNKATLGHVKGAGLKSAPIFLKEIRIESSESENLPVVGDVLNPSEILQPGDIVNVTGTSKGKGFAGGVKRYGFHGGPKTHGQSDRHRAPGSVGQGTTPGRVYKGKRMAGNMGNDQVTVKNLKVVDVNDTQVLIEGLVPGVVGSYIVIKKVGEDKKFVPLYREPIQADKEPVGEPEEQEKQVNSPSESEAVLEPSAEEVIVEAKPEEAIAEPQSEEVVPDAEEVKEDANASS